MNIANANEEKMLHWRLETYLENVKIKVYFIDKNAQEFYPIQWSQLLVALLRKHFSSHYVSW